ncbi:MAG: hypothetical protein HYT28_01585 [Parcubacteria group bacterium]|nr:hypothetical protein [Parcubacteria group bacterium]
MLFRITGMAAFALLVGGLAIWGLHQDSVRVHVVTVQGNVAIASTTLTAMMTESIAGTYAFLVPKDTVLFYPREAMVASILSAYPRIKTADIKTQNFDTIVLSLTERKPEYVWCNHPTVAKEIAETPTCYFADDSGYIFDRAPSFSNPVFFEVESPLVNEFGSPRAGNPVGNFILPEEALKKIVVFKDRLSVAGIETIALRVLPGDDYELRIKNGGKIIFNGKQNFDTVLENLSAALRVSDLSKALDGAFLQYIDLRFGNKVFYKLVK